MLLFSFAVLLSIQSTIGSSKRGDKGRTNRLIPEYQFETTERSSTGPFGMLLPPFRQRASGIYIDEDELNVVGVPITRPSPTFTFEEVPITIPSPTFTFEEVPITINVPFRQRSSGSNRQDHGIYIDEHELDAVDLQKVHDADDKCHAKRCCRLDDDQISFPRANSQCQHNSYMDCLSSTNECVWDCALPQRESSPIKYKHKFRGIDKRKSKSIYRPQRTRRMDEEENDKHVIDENYLSTAVMDECGTSYQLQLEPDSIEKELDAVNNSPRSDYAPSNNDVIHINSRRLGVLGDDDRLTITQKVAPYSSNVFISYETGDGPFQCSGALISPRHVLTAGHCVSDGNGNYHSNFIIYPSLNAGNDGEVSFEFESVWTFNQWHTGCELECGYGYDLAIITLKTEDTGIGYFGFGYDDDITSMDTFVVNGYPADKANLLQLQLMQMDQGIIENELKTSSGDIIGGNSGGPAWRKMDGNIINGVVSYEYYILMDNGDRIHKYNSMARITKPKFDAMCAHLRTFPETVDRC